MQKKVMPDVICNCLLPILFKVEFHIDIVLDLATLTGVYGVNDENVV